MNPSPICICALLASATWAQDQVTVFAAASLTNAIGDLANAYEAKTGVKILTSFASSATLAKQIENGAPADLFFSADLKWMDYLADKKQIDTASRVDVLGNALVIITPKDKPFTVKVEAGFDFPGAFTGRLALGDPASVPIGIYCKEAFTKLGWWAALEPRLAPAGDVRASLRLVETGEADAGVVYATDAKSSAKVAVIAAIPSQLHKPVRYPLARTIKAVAASSDLLTFLNGAEAAKVYESYGFTVLGKPAPTK